MAESTLKNTPNKLETKCNLFVQYSYPVLKDMGVSLQGNMPYKWIRE